MSATIFVVVFRFCDRVIDVDRRNLQLAILQHIDEAVNASGSFFGHSVDASEHFWIFLVNHGGQVTAIVQQHVCVPRPAIFQNGLLNTPFAFFIGLTFPGVDRNTGCDDGRRSFILC